MDILNNREGGHLKLASINNLISKDLLDESDLIRLASEISVLANINTVVCNDGTYNEEDLMRISSSKTPDKICNLIRNAYVVIMRNQLGELIGCGMIVRQDDRYFEKCLHVRSDYQGKGYGKIICRERDAFLKKINVKEVFIESLKMKSTIDFHKRRGYSQTEPYKQLRNTVLMLKIYE